MKVHDKARLCRHCKGTGIDKKLQFRYTTGGHDDRSCEYCNGEGVIEDNGQVEQEGLCSPRLTVNQMA